MSKKIVPVREMAPNLPQHREKSDNPPIFGREELFAFDCETTSDGLKELRSYQAAYVKDGQLNVVVIAVKGWFPDGWTTTTQSDLEVLLGKSVIGDFIEADTIDDLRRQSQRFHEYLMYDGEPRLIRNKKGQMRRSKRPIVRCAVAFNGNFDYGAMSDATELLPEMQLGHMEGAGVKYIFNSGDYFEDDKEWGMRINALYLGGDSIPYTEKRGQLWELSAPCRQVWGCMTLKQVGNHIGIQKLDADFNCPVYATVDAILTLYASFQMTDDLQRMGFTGAPDRFISGATVSKDLMRQHYTPFYLTEQQHELVWPAYFGGMTGAVRPEVVRSQVTDVVYGDLDGAYNVSGQRLQVFKWSGCKQLKPQDAEEMVRQVQKDPSNFWKYGSLHLQVIGDFDRVPVRVGTIGATSDKAPSQSTGLVWAKMRNYKTTLTIGDLLMSEPRRYEILDAVMAISEGESKCLFKYTADQRSKYPKSVDPIANTWWKLAGNCCYGVFANRNGKDRMESGPYFNALIASSITGAIRYAMWTVNESAGKSSHYNDTDSALLDSDAFQKAVEALKPLQIGFSNKTDDELPNLDVAQFAIVQGSKRYCMVGYDGSFGAKVHGLGSWFAFIDGRVRSIAHHKELIHTVWKCAYPDELGEPSVNLKSIPVFHRFNVKSQRVSDLTKEYARRMGVPLEDCWKYGKAGLFGFVVPTILDGKVSPTLAFDANDAAELSCYTLEMVAYGWSEAVDKKYDYDNDDRWVFFGEDVKTVAPISHTQMMQTAEAMVLDGDISIGYVGTQEMIE